jgi:hypothetical protein
MQPRSARGSLSRKATLALLAVSAALGPPGCVGDQTTASPGIPEDVKAIIFLQRVARNDGVGNVFDYTSYEPGGRLVKLEPPSANGKLTVLTHDPLFTDADVMSWDLSFDASTVVIAARTKSEKNYQLYLLALDGSNVRQLTEGPYDHVYPIFLPGRKILYTTNKSVEPDSPQFQDEYERQTTTQVGIVDMDGKKAETLGARNVSHRVAPALMPDGNVLYSEWRHLGNVNDGHLRFMNTDMTGMREAFGGEGVGTTNSYLKARYVQSLKLPGGRESFRIVTIGTSRDRTLQAGKLLLVDLNGTEHDAKMTDLTPLVPGGRTPSAMGVGRYYDAEPIGDPTENKFLVSWADGPVESSVLEMAKTKPNFGVYMFQPDNKSGQRFPIYDDPKYWDVMARPVKARTEPPVTQTPNAGGAPDQGFVLGAANVYESSVFPDLVRGSAVKVRLLEGFSGEEGFPDMFGLTEFDGQSRYGEVDVYSDGSFAARVPANVPVHMQLIDKFAMSLATEDIWVSGRPGEQRTCGGCHEDRGKPTLIAPGSTQAAQRGPVDLNTPRAERLSTDFSYGKIRGVPWNTVLQPIFDAKCVSCHNGQPGNGNKTYTVTDQATGLSQTFTFDLSAKSVKLTVGEQSYQDFPASYVSLIGLEMELGEAKVVITGDRFSYVTPGSARESDVIKKLNPPQFFPTPDPQARAFPGAVHPADVGGQELTAQEYYQLILNIDMGAQYYFRENKGAYTAPVMP